MRAPKKIYIFFVISVSTLLLAYYSLYIITNPRCVYTPDLSNSKYFIAHATGSLEGYTYLNSKESLMASLKNGYTKIEIDLQLTSDSVLVCVHNWEQFNKMTIPNICKKDSETYKKIPSYKEFKSRIIYNRFTPLSLSDVLKIQQYHPFSIVTDRISDPKILNKYFNKSIRHNVMVEAFSDEDYQALKKYGYTPMLSMGKFSLTHGGIQIIFSQLFGNKYEWIAAEQHCSKRTLRLLKKMFGIKFALATVNSEKFFSWHLANDIELVYTDNWNLKTQLNNNQNNYD